MNSEHSISDLKKLYVAHGPFSEITVREFNLTFRVDQGVLKVSFKYDLMFGSYDSESDSKLFIGIDVRDLPDRFKRSHRGTYEYLEASYIDYKSESEYYRVDSLSNRLELPSEDSRYIRWEFMNPSELAHTRVTVEPLRIVDIPIYLHRSFTIGYGIANNLNNVDRKEPVFLLRIDMRTNSRMLLYRPSEDLQISFEKLDGQDREIVIELHMRDLPGFMMPRSAKEVSREVLVDYSSDQDDRTLALNRQIKSCLMEWTRIGEGACRLAIQDITSNSKGGYTYTPMNPKWFLKFD